MELIVVHRYVHLYPWTSGNARQAPTTSGRPRIPLRLPHRAGVPHERPPACARVGPQASGRPAPGRRHIRPAVRPGQGFDSHGGRRLCGAGDQHSPRHRHREKARRTEDRHHQRSGATPVRYRPARPDGPPIPHHAFLQPKAEAEIALVLGADLGDGPFTTGDLIRAVEYAVPAIEIVDSRIDGWDITLADTIADNASSGGFVLGNTPVNLVGLDLRTAAMSLVRNGQEVSTGTAADCLGHPLNAAVWLANTLTRTGFSLRAGDIVLTGALGPMVPVGPGDVFEARIEGVGSATAVFEKANTSERGTVTDQ
jgi:hypothetical protein